MNRHLVWAVWLCVSVPVLADPTPASPPPIRIGAKTPPGEVLRRIGTAARTYFERKRDAAKAAGKDPNEEARFPWSVGNDDLRGCCPSRTCEAHNRWGEDFGFVIDAGQRFSFSFDEHGYGDTSTFRARAVADPTCTGAFEVWQVEGSIGRAGKVTVTAPKRLDLAPCRGAAKRWEELVLAFYTKQRISDDEDDRRIDLLLGREPAPKTTAKPKVDPRDLERAREDGAEALGKCIEEGWGPARRACMTKLDNPRQASACITADLAPECRAFAKQVARTLGPHPSATDIRALGVECVERFTSETRACILAELTPKNLAACREVASFYSYYVKSGDVTVTGGRDLHEVTRRLAWRLPMINECVLDERTVLPDLVGTWTLKLEVARSGAITKVDMTGLDALDDLRTCIDKAVRPLPLGHASQTSNVTWTVRVTAER